MISDRKGMFDKYGKEGQGFGFFYFSAFYSSVECPYLGRDYCCSRLQESYNCVKVMPDKSSLGTGTPRYFRFEYYVSNYIDYTKVYFYSKTTSYESYETLPSNNEYSNVIEWVRYMPK